MALLSGCAGLVPAERGDLAALLPELFATPDPVAYATTGPRWEDSFSDAVLVEDLARLRQDNKSVAAIRARIRQRLAERGIAEAALWPTVTADPSFERERERTDGNDPTVASTLTLGAGLSWELDVWGRLRAEEAAAGLSVEQERALLEQSILSLQLALVQNWIAAQAAARLQAVTLSQQETNRQFLSLTELRLAQGQGRALDVLLQRGRLLATERELPPIVAEERRAWNAYAVLLGDYPSRETASVGTWQELAAIAEVPSPRQLLERRPDLRAARFRLLRIDQEVVAAVADRLPRLSIGLTYNVSGPNLGDLGTGRLLNFTTGLLAPIFDGGRRQAAVSRRRAEALEALADLEQAMLVAVQEIEDALITERATFEERDLLRREIDVARQSVETARTRYVNGQVPYLSILDALERLQGLRNREIRLEQTLMRNRAALLVALGSVWELDDEN